MVADKRLRIVFTLEYDNPFPDSEDSADAYNSINELYIQKLIHKGMPDLNVKIIRHM